MMSLHNWFRRSPKVGRTRATVIVSETTAADPPNRDLALESNKAQINLIQSILEMERKAATLNTTLAELTLKNFNGGH